MKKIYIKDKILFNKDGGVKSLIKDVRFFLCYINLRVYKIKYILNIVNF